MLGYWQDQEYGVHYYQWTKDQRSLLFPLVHCFQRWGLIDPGFAAAIKRTSPEKEPLVQIKIVMRDHSGIGEPACSCLPSALLVCICLQVFLVSEFMHLHCSFKMTCCNHHGHPDTSVWQNIVACA